MQYASWTRVLLTLMGCCLIPLPTAASPPRPVDRQVACDLLITGGGLAGAATAYESLRAGRTVCLTEITDWVGGQISSQGTSALDERPTQRKLRFFPRGYLELRDRIQADAGSSNPGECWVSEVCFLPRNGHKILMNMLQDAAREGNGVLHWFPTTVVKEIELNPSGRQIEQVIAIQHQPATGAPPLNTAPLSQTIEEAYTYTDSDRFTKTIIQFGPNQSDERQETSSSSQPSWYVVEATETGALIALADIPYRLGIDPRTYLEPSSASVDRDPYCTQGFTYTFAMEQTATAQDVVMPDFYPQYSGYYSYELSRLASFPLVFTYRRILRAPELPQTYSTVSGIKFLTPGPGDISMQNWTWGNDYRPGTAADNLILTREQLQSSGQLVPGQWRGGMRVESLHRAEEAAMGFFYWLVAGTTDSQLGAGVKMPHPNHRYVTGLDSPMGTLHGLSKFPYMREVRRIVGRPSYGYAQGFTIEETNITRKPFTAEFYRETLSPEMLRNLGIALGGLETTARAINNQIPNPIRRRTRSTIYPDSVGIGDYNIDFHPCMALSPPERPGNFEYPGFRQSDGQTYPFQIPLRAMIPQRIDNVLVAGKSIATSQIAAAAYRVQSFEWSAGAAAGITLDFALEQGVAPYELVDDLPRPEPKLAVLQQRLVQRQNPIAFPGTSIFNNDWENWQ